MSLFSYFIGDTKSRKLEIKINEQWLKSVRLCKPTNKFSLITFCEQLAEEEEKGRRGRQEG